MLLHRSEGLGVVGAQCALHRSALEVYLVLGVAGCALDVAGRILGVAGNILGVAGGALPCTSN